jgi:type IX secretion system PorP/SprF family membrane protein
MNIKQSIKYCRVVITGLIIYSLFGPVSAQVTPYYPVSYRLLSPFVFNPAMAGSKDFSSIDYSFSNYRRVGSHLLSSNLRIPRSEGKYYSSLSNTQYTGLGVGAYLFDDHTPEWRNTGAAASLSWHVQLDRQAISFLSFGITAKAILSRPEESYEDAAVYDKKIHPDADAGIYFYNASFYAGLSVTNLLDNHPEIDSMYYTAVPYDRQLFFTTGYKFILSKKSNIVVEPGLIISSDDSFSRDLSRMFKPSLRIYAGNFCVGSLYNEPHKIPFFIQYKYSRLYLSAFFELPTGSAFYKQPARAELGIGLNLSAFSKGYYKQNHW